MDSVRKKLICREQHCYIYDKYDDGHEFLACTRCGTIFMDTRNRLTYTERRELLGAVMFALFGLPLLWAFIWLYWIAFS